MKINTSQGSAEKARSLKETESAKSTSETKGKKKSSKSEAIETGVSDKVSISGRAKDAAYAKELAKSSPDVNEEKVARLKEQIRSGSYKVDADRVADKLVDEHLLSAF